VGTTVAPALIPAPVNARRLASGAQIPFIGLGTFGSDRYGPSEVAGAVREGIRVGYRLIDCAAVYANEREIGAALRDAFQRTPREDFFVVSKVWNNAHEPAAAVQSVEQSLSDLGVDYLDALFVHWPFANTHAPHAEPDARDPHATPYDHDRFMRLWRALEELVEQGRIRHLGTSNMTIPKLKFLLRDAEIRPALNEMELHPCFQQPELFQFCLDHDIQPIGYSPMGSPSRPERDKAEEDIVDIEHPVVVEIAEAHGVHPAAVCLKWAVARGQIPIPFSVKPGQIESNFSAAMTDPLTPAERERLRSVDRNNRLIKGQVFLWQGAESWLDLWDVDGTIPGWKGYNS